MLAPGNLQKALSGRVEEMARRLLGATLIRTIDGRAITVRIVETEAYDQLDPASHSFGGNKGRSSTMFGEAGVAYVYLIYGMYHCLNVVTGESGEGEAVLIRAVEPLGQDLEQNTDGPGKLCKALAIDRTLNGHNLEQPPLQLILQPPLNPREIIETTRIGLSRNLEALRRYYIKGNPHISRP